MDTDTLEHSMLGIDTVLGPDHFTLVSLRGRDAISNCFGYDLELASEDATVQPEDLLGTSATIWLHEGDELSVPINGIISRFGMSRVDELGLNIYHVRLVPSLWLLTRTSDCRIFQDLSVSQIVDALLTEHGITDRTWRLIGDHTPRDYCVQYRETAFDFISRLLESEGIFFYFDHGADSHTVVFVDSNHGLAKCANRRVVTTPDVGAVGGIWEWQDTYRLRSSHWALTDYNFETPSISLLTETNTINPVLARRPFEMFDFPGRFQARSPGVANTRLRMEYEESAYETIAGQGACIGFSAGACFRLANLKGAAGATEYLITSVEHVAQDWSRFVRNGAVPTYSNRFHCMPRSVPYRPEMKTPGPRIHGTQTAVVTGPAGTEIFTDKYGRIKVQFHWDRRGKKDENSSCFVRVAQSWAGRGFGTIFLPRIGQEVVVSFEEGDPDRPLIVGSVYNAEQTVPFALPANKTKSGVRTRSTLNGTPANCNELVFEDLKGSEYIQLHAERDLMTEVENDASHWVGNDELTTIDHNRTERVKHDETITVDNNRTETVHGNETTTIDKDRTEAVHGNETMTIDKNRTETVHANETIVIDKNRSHTVGKQDTLTVGTSRSQTIGEAETITVGTTRSVIVGSSQSEIIGANHAMAIGGSQTITLGSDQATSIGGRETRSVAKNRATSIGGDDTLDVGKKLLITAADQIVLKTGDAMLILQKDGTILLKGNLISILGSAGIALKGQAAMAV